MIRWLTYFVLLIGIQTTYGQVFEHRNYYDAGKTQLKEIIEISTADSSLNGLYQSFFQNGVLRVAEVGQGREAQSRTQRRDGKGWKHV